MPSAPPSKRAPSSQTQPAASGSTMRGPDAPADADEVKPYILGAQIGKGSFATVFKGYHEETQQTVAIKSIMRDKLAGKLLENLQGEINILKSLSHRHITKLIDIRRAEHHIYLFIEYCSGGDLTNYIKKRGRVEGLEYRPTPDAAFQYYPHPKTGGLSETVVRSFLRQLGRALRFLRTRNLIHRDIKPQNLLLNPPLASELAKGHPIGVPILKVADFGFARSLPNAMMAETLCGSPLYMAPEILRYEKYDAKADLWSIGVVLYEMSVGKTPYRANNPQELIKRIERSRGVSFPDEDPARATEGIIPVPPDIKTLIRSLLKHQPVERSSFDDFFGSTALARSKFPAPGTQSQSRDDLASASASSSAVQTAPPEQPVKQAARPAIPIPVPSSSSRQNSPANSPKYTQDILSGSPARRISLKPDPKRQVDRPTMPGENDEDGRLRHEYVMVGGSKEVQFDKTLDEIHAGTRRRIGQDRPSLSPRLADLEMAPSPPRTTSFPPPPNSNLPAPSPPRAGANALSRALSNASKRLFGATGVATPYIPSRYRDNGAPSSPRRQQILLGKTGDDTDEKAQLERELLGDLEELAQKTSVLTAWANDYYESVKAVPQKPLPNPLRHVRQAGESERASEERLRLDVGNEYNAAICIAIYVLLMSFSQKGIDRLRDHQEAVKSRSPDAEFYASEGFDDALNWFRDHFLKCSERVALVKSWLSAPSDIGRHKVDQLDHLLYERALSLGKKAASKELSEQITNHEECEKLYEDALWCLYALQDDLLVQASNPFLEDDRNTVVSWISKIKLRLVRCRGRMAAAEKDRLSEGRADGSPSDPPRLHGSPRSSPRSLLR